jgi:hypothetical protein
MLNPNINKLVTVQILKTIHKRESKISAVYRGYELPVYLHKRLTIHAGNRRLWLRYSVLMDQYYLTDRVI